LSGDARRGRGIREQKSFVGFENYGDFLEPAQERGRKGEERRGEERMAGSCTDLKGQIARLQARQEATHRE
jgi:hypothetical protein